MSLLTEQDRAKAKAIVHCLFNDPQCSPSLQVEAGAAIQNLLSTLKATEQQLAAITAENEALMERCIRSENEMYRATEERDALKAWKAGAEGQEPVAWMTENDLERFADRPGRELGAWAYSVKPLALSQIICEPLYRHPSPASIEMARQEEREAVIRWLRALVESKVSSSRGGLGEMYASTEAGALSNSARILAEHPEVLDQHREAIRARDTKGEG